MGGVVWYGGSGTPPAPSANAVHSFYTYIFLSTYASVQERKLQDLEVELETRTKDVKATLTKLDIQVRESGGERDLQVPLTLESQLPQERADLPAP